MNDDYEVEFRESEADDLDAIRGVHHSAFPEDERDSVIRLALELARTASETRTLSLLAERDDRVVGHVVFSPVRIEKSGGLEGYILSPLGVSSEAQGGGVGSALVRAGLKRLKSDGIDVVLVYGDPKYYGRFGFEAGLGERFVAPHPLQHPFGWQALRLATDVTLPARPAPIHCVDPLNDPAMW
jgi:putative acetyltransferase